MVSKLVSQCGYVRAMRERERGRERGGKRERGGGRERESASVQMPLIALPAVYESLIQWK